MKVVNNLLEFDNGNKVEFKKSPNISGVMVPSYLIIHYDGSPNSTGAIGWMISKESKVSAHLHISREGKIVQLVPFNIVAWHAGVSVWKGIIGLNSHSIGIELQNSGNQEYTEIQLKVLTEVSKALVSNYHLKEILGHSDIAPIRKIDPGKQFPMLKLRSDVYGAGNVETKTVTADVLNVRSGKGTDFPVIGTIKKGDEVNVLETDESWLKVLICGHQLTGYVSSKYLK